MTLKGHSSQVTGGAFLGDDSHVITCSIGKSIRMWRTFDGVQIATYPCLFVRPFGIHILFLTFDIRRFRCRIMLPLET